MRFFKGTAAQRAGSDKTGEAGDLVIESDTGKVAVADGTNTLGDLQLLARANEVTAAQAAAATDATTKANAAQSAAVTAAATDATTKAAAARAGAVTDVTTDISGGTGPVATALSASIEAQVETTVPAEVTAQLAASSDVVDAAAAKALAGTGLVTTAQTTAVTRNRVKDPQLKTTGGSTSNTQMPVTRITTGLPTVNGKAIANGVETVRASTLSAVIANISNGYNNGAVQTANATPVTVGEVISAAAYGWTDQASARARLDLYWFQSDGTFISISSGTYSNIVVPSTWEKRTRSGVTVPALAAYVAPVMVIATQSGNTVTGAKGRGTAFLVVSGTDTTLTYADGTYDDWAWDGTAHLSTSRQWKLDGTTLNTLGGIPARVTALEGAGGITLLSVTKAGQAVTYTSKRGSTTVANQGVLNGSSNGAYSIEGDLYAGASFRPGTDEVCPIRSQLDTLGGNHGFSQVKTFTNPDGKTLAGDFGSRWTDGTREYVLLDIVGGLLVMGGSWAGGGGTPVTTATVAPTANLTHVSGATHTGAIDYTTQAATQLYPSIGRPQVKLFADGAEVTTDSTTVCRMAEVRETYDILDYASLYDTAKAHVGSNLAALASTIDGAVRVSNVYRYRPGGLCEVETELVELKPTTLGNCGAIQSATITAPTRYVPGVGSADGNNWTTGVDMSTYSTNSIISESEITGTLAPSFAMDVNATGAWVVGYLPYGRRGDENSRSTARLAQAGDVELWDMRGTDKIYPIFIDGAAAGWGRVTANAFRAILTPAEATTVLAAKSSAAAAFAALDAILGLTHA